MAKTCYKTDFPTPPETVSPTYTTDPALINDFIAKAETLWNWILIIMKKDDTDKRTFAHFIKELKDSCLSLDSWSTADKPYAQGAIVKDANGNVWTNLSNNNNEEPTIPTINKPDNWSLTGDLRRVAIIECFTIECATATELKNAFDYASHKILLCDLTIKLTSASYTIGDSLIIAGSNDGRYHIIVDGNGATINGTNAKILDIKTSSVKIKDLTIKGSGTNMGIYSEGSVIKLTKNTIRIEDCQEGIYSEGGSQFIGEQLRFRNCKYSIVATNGGYCNTPKADIQSSIASSIGIRATWNGTIIADNSTVDGCWANVYGGNSGSVRVQSGTFKNAQFANVYTASQAYVYIPRSTISGGNYGIYNTTCSTCNAFDSKITGASTNPLYNTEGAYSNIKDATGTGEVKIYKSFNMINAIGASGFTYSQTVNNRSWHGIIYG